MIERVTRCYTKEEVLALMDPLIAEWFNGKFEDLTEPQSYAIPLIHRRENVLVSSPTGSGKTLTAFLAIINELVSYSKKGKLEDRVYAVYVSPLKALANDINRNLEEPLREMKALAEKKGLEFPDIRVGVRSGDTSSYERQRMLRRPPHIFITTPESLALVLAAPKFRERFSEVEYVIVDEVHELCDSKRGVMLSLTLERLQAYCERRFVRIGLSATLAPIEEIAAFLAGFEDGKQRPIKIVEVRSQKNLDLKVLCPTEDMTALPYEIVNSKMYDMLKDLIEKHTTTLIFTNTRSGTENVVYKLKERGVEAIEAHHGSLSKETRLDVEERLKKGELRCVVSSTSLELGIDIGSIDLVCQIGSPKSVAKALQRIGRSGHGYRQTSKGRLIVFDNDDLVECAVLSRAVKRNQIDRVSIPENCLDVLAQTIVGMSIEKRWDVKDALGIIRRSYCYRNLKEEQFYDVLRYLGSKDEFEGVYSKIWYDEVEGRFGRKRGARMIYSLNLGTIPEEANYTVYTEKGGQVGDVSEKFVERLTPKDIFVLGGRTYEYVRTKGMRVFVKTATGRKPTVPSWTGEMLPRSFDLSIEIARFRREMAAKLKEDEEKTIRWLVADFNIDYGSARSIISYFKEQQAACGIIPNDRVLVVEGYRDMAGNYSIVFHFPFGRRVNDALSRAYAFQLTKSLNCNVSVSVTDDAFLLNMPKRVDLDGIEKIVSSNDLENILRRAVRDSEIFKQRFRHTAARSFMILRNYKGREVSVNRQQLRSGYLLDALGNIEKMPIIEETYREILNDVMDLQNAKLVLSLIEKGEIAVKAIDYSSTPSPFAHGVILAGISDIVLMEDRSSLLKELHRKILSKVLVAELSEFEFDSERVAAYFRKKLGTIEKKEDILNLLRLAGPMRIFKERARSIYPYASKDRKTVEKWAEELLEEMKIASVFIDDFYFVASDDLNTFATVFSKERSLGDLERRVLDALGEEKTQAQIAQTIGIDLEKVSRVIHVLESTQLVGRVAHRGGQWFFKRRDITKRPYDDSLQIAVRKFLASNGPATVEEIAYALMQAEEKVLDSVESLVNEGVLVKGKFIVSEKPQYMLRVDYLRLRSESLVAFDSRTVESYRRWKLDGPFNSIEECLRFLGGVGDPLDVFYRVPGFTMEEWECLRKSGRILLGRFHRGRVRYVLSDDAPLYVSAYSTSAIGRWEIEILDLIRRHGSLSFRQLASLVNMTKEQLRTVLERLDRNLLIIRLYDENENLSRENFYGCLNVPPYEGDAKEEIVRRFVRAYGPVSLQAVLGYTGFSPGEIEAILDREEIARINVGESQVEMFIFADELDKLECFTGSVKETRIRSLHDPVVQPLWTEIASRYGDKWVYPVMRDGTLIGAVEEWRMSGCIEIRAIDLDDHGVLDEVLNAIDDMMVFYRQLGYDIVRVKEALGAQVEELSDELIAKFHDAGYHRIGRSLIKGNFVPQVYAWEQVLQYIFSRQSIYPQNNFENVLVAVKKTGGFRADPPAYLRSKVRVPLKKLLEQGMLVRAQVIPSFMTYTTVEFASLCRKARNGEITDDMKLLLRVISDYYSISREELFTASPLGYGRTHAALKKLVEISAVYFDGKRRISVVPDIDLTVDEARTRLVEHLFENYGIFSAENLARMLDFIMPMRDLRRLLANLEREGLLAKGYFISDDETLYWILNNDLPLKEIEYEDGFVLTTDDNLYFYLQPWLKKEAGQRAEAIFKGPRLIGSFKAHRLGTDLYLDEFHGGQEAKRILNAHLRINNFTLRKSREEKIPDWEVQEFYEKTHPGEV
ncbi:MAG: ATP-dependent helicase [Methanomassiliicoccales archaeon]|jgi:ATP-dependent Lhr-like helicase|nr:ATP-dependent helicase [Methanomassiliicoccales archaeon]